MSEEPTTAVPLQVLLSKNFGRTIRHAMSLAIAREHDAVTSEHLLLALADDPDAAAVMRACGVDLDTLRRALTSALKRQRAAEVSRVHAIVQRAADHLHDTGELEVNGAHVLMAMLTDPAAEFLYAQGMAASDAITHVERSLRGRAPAPPPAPVAPADRATLAEVKLLNDDVTPMEFVVAVLERVFAMDRVAATRCVLEAHNHGTGTCGTYPRAVGAARTAHALDLARAHGHELRCVVT